MFSYNPSVEELQEWFRTKIILTDVERFMYDTMVRSVKLNDFVIKIIMYHRYKEWCEANDVIVLPENEFHRAVKGNRVFPVESHKPLSKVTGKQEWIYRGVKWKHQ